MFLWPKFLESCEIYGAKFMGQCRPNRKSRFTLEPPCSTADEGNAIPATLIQGKLREPKFPGSGTEIIPAINTVKIPTPEKTAGFGQRPRPLRIYK
jgi:hypothetical protein